MASKAGVAVSTACMVLGGRKGLSIPAETRERVKQAAESIGYRRKGRPRLTRNVAVLLQHGVRDAFRNPVVADIFKGIEEALEVVGYHCIVTRMRGSQDDCDVPDVVQDGKADGLILVGDMPEKLIEQLSAFGANAVCVDYDASPHFDSVMVDAQEVYRQVIEHLWSNGHRRIACLKTPPVCQSTIRSFRHIEQACSDLKLPADAIQLIDCPGGDIQDGYAGMKRYLAEHAKPEFTALFTSDLKVLGALDALREAGISVPEDVSLAGLSGIEATSTTRPGLSTIAYPLESMGREAVFRLMQRIERQTTLPCRLILPPHLVARQSVRSV